ncbi:hypothetical protein FBT69_09395 [Synechococcales cyanobacterium CNB]|nr:hypothetical protein [Leptolyngbya sp.]MCZ7632534.1 flagellar basal body P-ring protein FlgI [Phycisphaerales bacterium]MDL1905008.1 hypothetical protein [Synechococcales cyanobacterium CNB]
MQTIAGNRHRAAVALAVALAGSSLGLVACSSGKKKPSRVQPTPYVSREVEPILRGTVGSVATTRAGEMILLSGFGLVVGLNGTGGGTLPEPIAATMERTMSLRGLGRAASVEGTALINPLTGQPRSPREVLRDPNTAVVQVQAVLARGSPEGFRFDVFVEALNASSLEGGTLWSTDLRLGPPGLFGATQTRRIAQARGPIFINPFTDPGSAGTTTQRTVGRVLDGGVVVEPLSIVLNLDVPSHLVARRITEAINSRFPMGPGDDGPVARGRSDSIVELSVPAAYRERPAEYLTLIEFLHVDTLNTEVHARRFVDALKSQPEMSEELSWCLAALGDRALPFARELYGYPEIMPRMAALRAGVLLRDPMAAPHLEDLARNGVGAIRHDAIGMLGRIDSGPSTDMLLRELAGSRELTVRVAAYEAMVKRSQRAYLRQLVAREASRPAGAGPVMTQADLEFIATMTLPEDPIRRVRRTPVAGRFLLDRVPEGEPMVYITQQGTPKIVLFGSDIRLVKPLLASAWSDRLMVTADSQEEPARLYYRDHRTGRTTVQQVADDAESLIFFFAHEQTPEDPRPGLGLSYSEVVGALHALYESRALNASFTTETDRLVALLAEAAADTETMMRPESPTDAEIKRAERQIPTIHREVPRPTLVPIPPPSGRRGS